MLRFSACRMQDEFVNLDRILLHGGTAEDTDAAAAVIEDRQEGRRAAARARKDYDRALRSLNKVGGKNACVCFFLMLRRIAAPAGRPCAPLKWCRSSSCVRTIVDRV